MLRLAKLKGIPLSSENMMLLVSPPWDSRGSFSCGNGLKSVFTTVERTTCTFTVIKSIRHHSKASLKILKKKKERVDQFT